MKAQPYDQIRLLVPVRSEYRDRVIPAGAVGNVVDCYEKPREGYAADFPVDDPRLAGGKSYENVIVYPDQFDVV